ncbi:hypothetical protein C348_06909 [Cryptococcus neoformans Gb118]|nr:hypothetical protein C350_06922 [Cryptococcus neoformans var. grubii MW-RSA36]OXL04839.1 hypothetical protein C348_06909 [Cryptococcus neoformans var. grubii Gb118]
MPTNSTSTLNDSRPGTINPDVQIALSTPPSFLSHRRDLQSSGSANDKGAIDNLQDVHVHGHHQKRMSISSLAADLIVDPPRRVSPSNEAIGNGQKSPIYQIPQRLVRGSLSVSPETELSDKKYISKPRAKPQPLSFQGSPAISLSSPSSQSKFAITAAGKGLTISPSLARNPSSGFKPIWSASATLPDNTSSVWDSPVNSAKTVVSDSGTIGNAALVAKKRGLSIAIIKDNGGIVPISPSLGSAGLKSPEAGLKSAEMKMIGVKNDGETGHATGTSRLATGRLDSANSSVSKKEIILCKFYHTPGLTCTSRPCRFVHALSSLTSPLPTYDISQYAILSPTRPIDPTGGTFAFAQQQINQVPKQLKVGSNGIDLDVVEMGERVVFEDENGHEATGQMFLMSGGGKGVGGKSRNKYKTVTCKDFMEGRCQYGDYCSFLHDKKPRDLPLTDDKSSCTRDRKPISLNNSFSVSSKAGHKDLLIPSVRVDADVIDKSRSGGLPAFASRFSQTPVRVEPPREIVAAPTPKRKVSPAGSATLKAHTPPVPTSEPVSLPMAVATSAPPKSNAWFKGPPVPIKKIRSLKKVTIADMGHKRDLSVSLDAPLKTPTSAGALAIPLSAMSLWTESDPSTPFDPMTHRKRMLEIEEEAKKSGHIKVMPKSSLVNLAFDSSPAPSQVFTPSESFLPFTAPAYPWGMPMSPISLGAYQNPLIPDIKGGLGVIWTPTGWAVQDAAMKQTLRSPEIKQKFENEKKRPKSYYRTRPCKFFAEGHCPHGEECTFLHIIPASSPELLSSSDSDSANHKPKGQSNKPKTLPCKFFNSTAGCINGDDCAFLHARVVPESVPLVARPRPWRTKPCRHYQLGRCLLGDACHFAHVDDPTWVASGWKTGIMTPSKVENALEQLTTEKVEMTIKRIREMSKGRRDDDEEDDDEDDIQIVTYNTLSPSSSCYGSSFAV